MILAYIGIGFGNLFTPAQQNNLSYWAMAVTLLTILANIVLVIYHTSKGVSIFCKKKAMKQQLMKQSSKNKNQSGTIVSSLKGSNIAIKSFS